MSPIVHFIYIYIGRPGLSLADNKPFSEIFFDKFKNLLDDYIVNYQIKYFFYLLFISFFYLELSEGMFQLLHNYSPYHLSIFGSFLIDFCYSLFRIGVVDFFYSYFAFNLNSIGYFFSLLSHNNIWFSIVVMGMIVCSIIDKYENLKDELNLRLVAFSYFVYSFFFFLLFHFNISSLGFYISFTFFIILLSVLNAKTVLKPVDVITLLVILSFVVLPYVISFSLFVVATCLSLNQNSPFIYGKFLDANKFNLDPSFFGDLLMVGVLSFFIIPLDYAYFSPTFFILNSLPFFMYTIYIYRDDVYEPRVKKED